MTQLSVHTEGLTVITGCVKSGKTGELLKLLRHTDIIGEVSEYKAMLFTCSLGYSENERTLISDNYKREAIVIEAPSDILDRVNQEGEVNLVGIDNVHFLDRTIVDFCNHLVGKGVSVIAAGLNLDFKAEPFGPMEGLLVYADEILSKKAVCMVCGRNNATRSQRLVVENKRVAPRSTPLKVPGESALYITEPRCREHYIPPQFYN